MNRWSVSWTKTKRFGRLWFHDAISETLAPLTDGSARLNFIAVLLVVFLLSPWRGEERQLGEIITTLEALEVLLYSIPIFFALNLLFSVFRVRKRLRELGKWFGTRFVYHEPQHLLTALVDEHDNGQPVKFTVGDVDDGSLVSYTIETDRSDGRAKAEIGWPNGKRLIEGEPRHVPKVKIRLTPSKEMALLTYVEPESTLTTVRVFMTGWEVGKGDDRG